MKVSHRKKALIAEINMVPFIDVVLVLLIIFMVVSPFLAQSEMPIRLPRALSGLTAQTDEPLKIQVTKEGDYYLAGKRVLASDVENELKTALRGASGRAVMIEADRDVGFKNVVVALDAAERAGAGKVGVAVENPSPPVTPYILLSAVIHAAVIAGLVFGLPARSPEKKYYAVDFMGGQSGLGAGRLEPAPALAGGLAENPEAPKVENPPETPADKDERKVDLRKEDKKGKRDAKKKSHEKSAVKAPRNKGAKGGRGESADGKGDILGAKSGAVGGAGTSLEIGGFGPGGIQAGPRFPYNWYVNALYKRLWEAWDRTDAGTKSCGVAFTILRDGTVKEIKVEDTSGDGFFDMTARRAVEDAAPFSPLPEGFTEKELRVYVKFRLQ